MGDASHDHGSSGCGRDQVATSCKVSGVSSASDQISCEAGEIFRAFYNGNDNKFSPDRGPLQDLNERQHFADVCYSFLGYEDDCLDEIYTIASTIKSKVAPENLKLLPPGREQFPQQEQIVDLVRKNQDFFDRVVNLKERQGDLPPNFTNYGVPDWHDVEERNSTKVRCTLRQLIRDWSDEGARERESNYAPLLEALERHMPITTSMREGTTEPPRILCPGSGLGRLALDAVRRGYSACGNEFSYHMLFVADYIMNHTHEKLEHEVFPYVLSLRNRKKTADCLRGIKIPDVDPCDYIAKGKCPLSDFSVMAGEFVEVFKDMDNYFKAVLTCFFIDTAKNFVIYVDAFAKLLSEGCLWINIGPLLWHFANQPSEISVELSWEQCKKLISEYFEFVEEDTRNVYYTVDPLSMQNTLYKCVFYVARRNAKPVTGIHNPVYG